MKQKEIELFEKFLKSKRLLKHYKEETSKDGGDYDELMGVVYIAEAVSCGFVWGDSKRGHDFWNNIEIKFNTYCAKNQ